MIYSFLNEFFINCYIIRHNRVHLQQRRAQCPCKCFELFLLKGADLTDIPGDIGTIHKHLVHPHSKNTPISLWVFTIGPDFLQSSLSPVKNWLLPITYRTAVSPELPLLLVYRSSESPLTSSTNYFKVNSPQFMNLHKLFLAAEAGPINIYGPWAILLVRGKKEKAPLSSPQSEIAKWNTATDNEWGGWICKLTACLFTLWHPRVI